MIESGLTSEEIRASVSETPGKDDFLLSLKRDNPLFTWQETVEASRELHE